MLDKYLLSFQRDTEALRPNPSSGLSKANLRAPNSLDPENSTGPALTAYISSFQEEIITDIVLDLLGMAEQYFQLQSPSNCIVSLDSNFVRESGQVRKLGLREGKQLADDQLIHVGLQVQMSALMSHRLEYFPPCHASVFIVKAAVRAAVGPVLRGDYLRQMFLGSTQGQSSRKLMRTKNY